MFFAHRNHCQFWINLHTLVSLGLLIWYSLCLEHHEFFPPIFYLMKVLYSSCKFPLRHLVHVCVLSHFSHVQLCVTLWTVACQAPLSIGFSRQEHWSGLPCSPAGELPDPGIKPVESPASFALQADYLSLNYQGNPI